MSATDIYDFESIIENAVKAVFTAAGLTCFTPQDAATIDFQKERPRVEVEYQHGVGQNQWHIEQTAPNAFKDRRERAWKGQLVVALVTEANITIHCAYRAQVRSIMAGLWNQINGDGAEDCPWQYSVNGTPTDGKLRNHKLHYVGDAGTSPIYPMDQGMFKTTMNFNVDLSVQENAWALLNT